jgi:hypothetical protein
MKNLNNFTVGTTHPDFNKFYPIWERVKDCLDGEDQIKSQEEKYLPRPGGMSGEYADSYDAYLERAHFPLITSYALSGALGVIITKMPEFNVPKKLEYILDSATKDGRSIQQLFLDMVIEVFSTGKVPLVVDVIPDKSEFRFVQYTAFDFINWKTSQYDSTQDLILGVFREEANISEDLFTHNTETLYRVFYINENDQYESRVFTDDLEKVDLASIPTFMGKYIDTLPIFMGGSLNNSFNVQPVPLIPVANCSIKIYRKEADLANSEFLSCNPTLVVVGASNDDNLPNVVGSSVMIAIPNEAARVFYTTTDTQALTHVKNHITDLYDEAIRHGVAILDARKGVESAEALRIRQATQSASLYSIYLSCLNAIKQGLKLMCRWAGYNEDEVIADAPNTLTEGVPDASVMKTLLEGFGTVIPLNVIHRYMVSSGLIDQTIGFEEYLESLKETAAIADALNLTSKEVTDNKAENSEEGNSEPKKSTSTKESVISEGEGMEDKL